MSSHDSLIRRIARHAKAAEEAQAKGDIVTYCRERKAMLAAQYELYQQRHQEVAR